MIKMAVLSYLLWRKLLAWRYVLARVWSPFCMEAVIYRESQKKVSFWNFRIRNAYGKSGPFWTMSDNFGPFLHFGLFWTIWTILDRFGPFWTVWTILDRLDHFGPFGPFWTVWTILDHSGPFWTIWTILDNFGPFWTVLDYLGPFGPFGPFWIVFDQFWMHWILLHVDCY